MLLPAIPAPPETQSTIVYERGVTAVAVKSAPKGVIVLGALRDGRLAVAVARPRGSASGKVVLSVKGHAKTASRSCATLRGLHRLAGPKAPGLGGILAARACHRPDPSTAAALLARYGLGPAPMPAPAPPPAPAPSPTPASTPTPTATPTPPISPDCADGIDNDHDGTIDARESSADPDPGCTVPGASEGSDVSFVGRCSIGSGPDNQDPRRIWTAVSGCGAVKAVWFKPPGTPVGCVLELSFPAQQPCDVVGTTASASFAPTTANFEIAAELSDLPTRCAMISTAVELVDGTVISARGDWC